MDAEIDNEPSQVRCLRMQEWPAEDRRLATASCGPFDPFDELNYASTLRQPTLDKAFKGYGRWLWHLHSCGQLDPNIAPLARVTHKRLRAYFWALRAGRNSDYTIIGRFNELHTTLKIMCPGVDVSWVLRSFGERIYSLLPRTKRALLVPSSVIAWPWAIAMMDNSHTLPTRAARLIAFRDGLMLALLVCRARRLRSVTLLRVGQEFVRRGDHYRVELDVGQIKTQGTDHFDLPMALTPYIEHYLNVVRPALLARNTSDAFWISRRHTPWKAKAIQNQVTELTRKRFDVGFGPHRFRHMLVTTAALLDPDYPDLGAEVLNISSGVARENYNRAKQVKATQALDDILEGVQARVGGRDLTGT